MVSKILENCGLHSIIGIKVLIEKSLLNYSHRSGKEVIYMHDLLQEMGKNIILQESPNDFGRRSRLWSKEEIDLVLKGNKGTKKVQSIVLNLVQPYETFWDPDCFAKMQNLGLLYFTNVHLLHSINSLPSTLKVLKWRGYRLEALPHNIDQLHELVDLDLHHSKIRQLWNGTPFLGKLKFIDMSYPKDLIETPDFSGVPNLESLFFERCINLVKVHESVGQLKKLVKLSLKDCENLVFLPRKLELNSLKKFVLSGCSKLKKLPEFGENMKSLSIFDIEGTNNIREVPPSIVNLTSLKELSLHGCKGQVSKSCSLYMFSSRHLFSFKRTPTSMGLRLPNSFSGLFSLWKLDLSFCNLCDGSFPHDLSGLPSLFKLNLRGNNFVNLPSGCISNLSNLEHFDLSCRPRLQSIPKPPPNLSRVNASCCPSMEPLLDVQNLFASLVSQNRSLVLYEDIVLQLPGNEIPTWFKERKYYAYPDRSEYLPVEEYPHVSGVSIIADIPYVRYEFG